MSDAREKYKQKNYTDDQIDAIVTRGNLLISASAGTGKTTVMIERILSDVLAGKDITRIAAVTFSKASAEDIKEKLLGKLLEALRGADPTLAAHLKKQLKLVSTAYITTISGLCVELYRKYFEDIGGSANFKIADETQSQTLKNRAISDVFERYLTEGDQKFARLAAVFQKRRELDEFKKTVFGLMSNLDVLPDREGAAERFVQLASLHCEEHPRTAYFLQNRRREASKLAQIAAIYAKEAEDYDMVADAETYQGIIMVLDGICRCATLKDYCNYTAAISLPNIKKLTENKDEGEDAVAEKRAELHEKLKSFKAETIKLWAAFKDTTGDYDQLCEEDRLSSELAVSLLEVVLQSAAAFADLKREENVIDFSDMERFALKILSNPERAAEVSGGLDCVYIDEYQDTNYLQEEILKKISRADNLFAVGDAKQAIYRFRLAEPKIFFDRYDRYRSGAEGRNIPLNHNFRTTKRLINVINLIFSEIMTDDFGGIDYKNSAKLIWGEKKVIKNEKPFAEIVFFEPPKKPSEILQTIYSVKNAQRGSKEISKEAQYIADKINEFVGKVQITDPASGKPRLVNYDDIAILTRNGNERSILNGLDENGIPYYAAEYQKDDENSADVDDLAALVRVVDNSRNDYPLVRSLLAFGSLTEEELLTVRGTQKGFFWECALGYQADDQIAEKLKLFIGRIKNLRTAAAAEGTYGMLCEAERLFDLQKRLLACQNGRARAAKVRSFIESSRASDFAKSVAAFVQYLDVAAKQRTENPTSEGAVNIMTIHKSKGLEFPIVFLAKCEKGFSDNNNRQDVSIDRDFGISVNTYDEEEREKKTSFAMLVCRLKNKAEAKEDLLRLFYVAVTRARYHLFITAEGKVKNDIHYAEDAVNFMQWLHFARGRNSALAGYFVQPDFQNAPPNATAEIKSGYAEEPILRKPYAHQSALALSAKYTVSQINKRDYEEEDYPKTTQLGGVTSDLGILYHTIAEKIDLTLSQTDEIVAAVDRIMAEEGLEAVAGFRHEAIVRLLQQPFMQLAREGRVLREQPFLLRISAKEAELADSTDCVLVQGVADLVILGRENILVDYKTSSLSMQDLAKRYRRQLQLYKHAVQKSYGITIDKTLIYSFNKATAIEVENNNI